ncbi:hypothetical protein ScPMuIL_009981 [Solemya velum]
MKARLDIPAAEVKAVYRTAMQLKMPSVAKACSSYLVMNLTPTNCLGTWMYATDHDLKERISCFIQENIQDVITSKNAISLPRVQVEVIVIGAEDDIVSLGDESHMFQLVLQWAKNNLGMNSKIDTLTEQVNVLYLNPDNTLCDSKFGSKNGEVHEEDIVTDYRNFSKKKQGSPNSVPENNEHTINSHFRKFDIPPENATIQREWSIIATYRTKDRSYLSFAVLHGNLTVISLHYRLPACSSVSSSEGPDSPVSERGGPLAKFFERHTSLTLLASMDSPRCGFGLRLLNQNLFACGGYNRSGECLQSAEMYNLAENKWKLLPEMNSIRCRFSMATVDGKIYACGGSNGHVQLKSCECYCSVENKWLEVADLPKAVASPGVAEFQGRVYCVGGCMETESVTYCFVYNQHTDKWKQIAHLNTARYQSSLCGFGGKLYAIGGTDGWTCLNSVEVYDPKSDQWQFTTPLTTGRRGAGVDILNGLLYVVGGSDGAHSLRTVEMLNPATWSWTQGPGLSMARANCGVAMLGDRLFAVGGFNGRKFLDSMEYLDLEMNEWCSYVPSDTEAVPFENCRNQSVKKGKKNGISSDFTESVRDTCSSLLVCVYKYIQCVGIQSEQNISPGTVTMWSPNLKTPLVKMLCHGGTVRSLAVDHRGTYMATSGVDRTLKIWDLRTFKMLQSYKIGTGAASLDFSQRELLALSKGNIVEVYRDCCRQAVSAPYMKHRLPDTARDLQFCPFEDVLGVGHGEGFSSLLIPGAGEANFDALEANPYQSKQQRRQAEVKLLLEKVPHEMISLDTTTIGHINTKSLKEKIEEKNKLHFIKPKKMEYEPKYKMKGRSKGQRKENRKQGVIETQKRKFVKEQIKLKQKKDRSGKVTEKRTRKSNVLDRFRTKPD